MPRRLLKALPILNVVIACVTILLFIYYGFYYYSIDDTFMMASSFAAIFIPLFIFIVDKLSGHRIPQVGKFVYLLFFFFSAGLGAIGNFYGTVPYYDKFIHTSMGLLFTWLFILGYERYKKHQKYDFRTFALSSICFTATLAVFWEICEFTFDLIFDKNVQKSNTDTMMDMIVAIVGCIIVTLIFIWRKKHYKRHE